MNPLRRAYDAVTLARDLRGWKIEHAKLVADQLVRRNRNAEAGYTDRDHLLAAADWLERAQDAMPDGGVGGRYTLDHGWTSSYPETTGYIVPTFLALAERLDRPRFVTRAERAVEFLLRQQTADGSFHGGEVAEATGRSSVFNTAQILNGFTSWYQASAEERVLAAARRAADWMVSVQDPDGAWRRFVYLDVAATYSAHASCWLAELGRAIEERRYLDAARRHLHWTLGQVDPATGWFDRAGFTAEDHQERIAVTHTIAYTLAGVLSTGEALGDEVAIRAVRRAALAIARRLELSKRLPGVLDQAWRPRAGYVCLTGNAQMALIWNRLFWLTGEGAFLNAALRAIDGVKRAQPMRSQDPAIRGGIPGSDPIWGGYISRAIPNWSAKFFVDAMLAKAQTLERLGERPRFATSPAAELVLGLPAIESPAPGAPVRSVLLTSAGRERAARVLGSLEQAGCHVGQVLVARIADPPRRTRIARKIRAEGFRWILNRRRKEAAPTVSASSGGPSLESYCASRGIGIVTTGPLDSPATVERLRGLEPDVVIQAGAGILRADLLAVPKLGTINAHMGLLPRYRGMNVAEWARFHGDHVGCTVHLIDPGIDTGDILAGRVVSTDGAGSIAELRARVDQAQLDLLGVVMGWIERAGRLPPRHPQSEEDGVQYFVLHPDLAAALNAELAGATLAAQAGQRTGATPTPQ